MNYIQHPENAKYFDLDYIKALSAAVQGVARWIVFAINYKIASEQLKDPNFKMENVVNNPSPN